MTMSLTSSSVRSRGSTQQRAPSLTVKDNYFDTDTSSRPSEIKEARSKLLSRALPSRRSLSGC